MAAGMGSRYGGLKQLDGVGPSGETIMDYSVFDAARAGFGKVVFVIGRHFERDFREKVLAKYEGRIPTEVVFQSVDALPDGFGLPYWVRFTIDARVLAFIVGITLVATIVSGLVPALVSAHSNAAEMMKEGGRGNSSHRRRCGPSRLRFFCHCLLLFAHGKIQCQQ